MVLMEVFMDPVNIKMKSVFSASFHSTWWKPRLLVGIWGGKYLCTSLIWDRFQFLLGIFSFISRHD